MQPNAQQAQAVLKNDSYGLVTFIFCCNVHHNMNFAQVLIPKRGNGVQWHRDVLPALGRWLRQEIGKSLTKAGSSTESIDDLTAKHLLESTIEKRNNWLWLMFNWEQHQPDPLPCGCTPHPIKRGVFRRIAFE